MKTAPVFVLPGVLTEAACGPSSETGLLKFSPWSLTRHPVLCLDLRYTSLSKMRPKISEKPKRLFFGSESTQKFSHIN